MNNSKPFRGASLVTEIPPAELDDEGNPIPTRGFVVGPEKVSVQGKIIEINFDVKAAEKQLMEYVRKNGQFPSIELAGNFVKNIFTRNLKELFDAHEIKP